MSVSLSPDRRAALKERHRAAILAAAIQLIDERGGPRFSVDELAERADVARRTVFNHFASVDEVLLTLCAASLDVIIDDLLSDAAALPVGDGSRASMFEEIAQVLRRVDLPSTVARIQLILGTPDPDDARGHALSDQAFARAGERLLHEVRRRNPSADPLDAELLVSSLMNGVLVIAKRWILATGVRLDADARDQWQALLTRLLENLRSGYLPES